MCTPPHLTVRFLPLVLSVLLVACGDVGDAPQAQTGQAMDVAGASGDPLVVDTARSELRWRAAKVTRAHDGGFHAFTGTVTVKGNEVMGVNLVVDARTIWSDTERLTGHLKSEDFFEVETYPTAMFEADRIVAVDSANATHLVTGNLTMRGQTHSITFPATITTQGGAVRATADFIIDRTHWGIIYTGKADDLIENEVRLMFEVVAAQPSRAPEAESPSPTTA
jgi:polyisoprenoid-binding protein YceI